MRHAFSPTCHFYKNAILCTRRTGNLLWTTQKASKSLDHVIKRIKRAENAAPSHYTMGESGEAIVTVGGK